MSRTSHVLEHEKQFSSYAAHELRTPLAALKTQLQVALRTKDKNKAAHLFQEMIPATERMQTLVEQLLLFVRVQRSDIHKTDLNFSNLCQQALQDLAGLAITTKRSLEGNINPNIHLKGNNEMLYALLRNLLSNALSYTHKGGHILLTLTQQSNEISLLIQDDGIGLLEADPQKLFDSFYRAASHHSKGSGLGLSIVKSVADAHNAEIQIIDGLMGHGTGFHIIFRT